MKERQGEHPLGDVGQIIAFIIFIIIWAADSFLFDFSTQLNARVPFYSKTIVTIVIFAVSLYLLATSYKVITGDHRPRRVITSGVFKYIRHPMYLSAVLFYLGLVVSSLSIVSFLMWILIFIFYNYIAGYEEKLMEMKYGEEYISYKQITGKWLPKF